MFVRMVPDLSSLFQISAVSVSVALIAHAIWIMQILRKPAVLKPVVEKAVYGVGGVLVFIGLAAIVGVFVHALSTGDWQSYGVFRGALIAVQGILPIMLIREQAEASG